MHRMSGIDAFLLGMETSRAYMHTYKIAILDPSTDPDGWSFEKYYRDCARRMHRVPLFRWKCAPDPLRLNHPLWVEDPDFDLAYHVRRVACPPPGDHRALCEFMSAIYSYKLDRDRPLWMQWVVEGLEGGKVALVLILHHAYIDGVGASHLMREFYRPVDGVAGPWQPAPLPGGWKRLGMALRDWPSVAIGSLPKVLFGVLRKVRVERHLRSEGKVYPSLSAMQQTPINRLVSPGRTFVCESMPLDRLRRVGKHFGATINDVFGACSAGAVRRLLRDLGHDPDQHPLIAGTPFAGDRPKGMEGLGNFASADFCWFRSDLADPRARLAAMHESNSEMKEHMAALKSAGADMNAVLQIVPPLGVKLLRRWIRRMKGKVGFFGNLGLSNVPGPKDYLYLDRWKVCDWFSIGMIMDGTTLNMTMWSYAGKATLSILIDREILSDGWVLYNYFVEELDALDALIPETAQ